MRWGTSLWWPLGPDTVDEFFDQPYWMRDVGGTYADDGTDNQADDDIANTTNPTPGIPGGGTVGGGGPPAGGSGTSGPGGAIPDVVGEEGTIGLPGFGILTPTTITYDRTAPYKFDVYDEDDVYIDTIDAWSNGWCTFPYNMESIVDLRVQGTDAITSELVPPNRLWLRDSWGLLMERCDIMKVKKFREGDAVYWDITGLSVLRKFSEEIIESYDTGYDANNEPEAKYVKDVLADILAFQTRAPIISIGYIDYNIANTEVTYSCARKTVQQALLGLQLILQKEYAGHFIITTKNKLLWYKHLGGVRNQTIELGKGLRGAEITVDYSERVDKVIYLGVGNDENNSLNLTHAGESENYILSPYYDAENNRTRIIVDRRIYLPAQLLSAAQRYIEEHQEAKTTLRLNVIELSKTDTPGFGTIESIFPGTEYHVIDSGLDLDTYVWVASIKYNLDNPLDIVVELTNRSVLMGDIIGAIVDQLQQPFILEDDGSRNPYIMRVFPNDYSPPDGHAYKNGDVKPDANGIPEIYNATSGEWVPLTAYIPWDGP